MLAGMLLVKTKLRAVRFIVPARRKFAMLGAHRIASGASGTLLEDLGGALCGAEIGGATVTCLAAAPGPAGLAQSRGGQ